MARQSDEDRFLNYPDNAGFQDDQREETFQEDEADAEFEEQLLSPEGEGYDELGAFGQDYEPTYEEDPAQDYWAREEDEFLLVSQLESQVEQFRNYQRSSAYWRWLIKNWQYAHSLFFDDQIDSIGVSALGDMGEIVGYGVNHFNQPSWSHSAFRLISPLIT